MTEFGESRGPLAASDAQAPSLSATSQGRLYCTSARAGVWARQHGAQQMYVFDGSRGVHLRYI